MRRIGLAIGGVCAVLLAGCASSAAHTNPPLGLTRESRPLPAGSPLTTCTDPHPAPARPVDTALARDFAGYRVRTAFSLDGGTFRAAPPSSTAAPRVSAALAYCNLLAGATAENSSVFDAATQHGMSFGLGVVTVSGSVRSDGGYVSPGRRETPTARYHARLAWIAVVKPDVVSSCPAMLPSPASRSAARAQPYLPPYQILAVDAETGAAGILYTARANNLCGFPGYRSATIAPAVEFVSVPWTLVSRGPGPQSATISYLPRPCDQPIEGTFIGTGRPVVLADRDHPGLVGVDLERVLTTCGSAVPTRVLLRSSTLATDLPTHLVHARVGAEDAPSS